jgi:hypothetical protein
MVSDQRRKPLPRVLLTSVLGVVGKQRRQHVLLDVIGGQVLLAGAEATILVQRQTRRPPAPLRAPRQRSVRRLGLREFRGGSFACPRVVEVARCIR